MSLIENVFFRKNFLERLISKFEAMKYILNHFLLVWNEITKIRMHCTKYRLSVARYCNLENLEKEVNHDFLCCG